MIDQKWLKILDCFSFIFRIIQELYTAQYVSFIIKTIHRSGYWHHRCLWRGKTKKHCKKRDFLSSIKITRGPNPRGETISASRFGPPGGPNLLADMGQGWPYPRVDLVQGDHISREPNLLGHRYRSKQQVLLSQLKSMARCEYIARLKLEFIWILMNNNNNNNNNI